MVEQDLGSDQSVLQNHYRRNRPPRAPVFQPVPATLHPHLLQPPADDPNPRNLESYPTQWQEIISNAKRSFRAYIAGTCGFPDGANGVQEAREYLADAAEVYLEEGGTLGQGDSVPIYRRPPTNRTLGYTINKDMSMIVST